jgi:hypothetical protein
MVTIKVENLIDPANFVDGEMARYIAYFKEARRGRRCRADSGRARSQDARRPHQERRPLA